MTTKSMFGIRRGRETDRPFLCQGRFLALTLGSVRPLDDGKEKLDVFLHMGSHGTFGPGGLAQWLSRRFQRGARSYAGAGLSKRNECWLRLITAGNRRRPPRLRRRLPIFGRVMAASVGPYLAPPFRFFDNQPSLVQLDPNEIAFRRNVVGGWQAGLSGRRTTPPANAAISWRKNLRPA